jgi:hypothetical protein
MSSRMMTAARERVVAGWCQGAVAQDKDGHAVGPGSSEARRWSMLGALLASWNGGPVEELGQAVTSLHTSTKHLRGAKRKRPEPAKISPRTGFAHAKASASTRRTAVWALSRKSASPRPSNPRLSSCGRAFYACGSKSFQSTTSNASSHGGRGFSFARRRADRDPVSKPRPRGRSRRSAIPVIACSPDCHPSRWFCRLSRVAAGGRTVTGRCESCSVELMRRLRKPATLWSLSSLTCPGSGRAKAVRLAGPSLS